MKVLMFGWEFPPHISGGLGTACFGLTKGLSQLSGIELTFVVPKLWGNEDLPGVTLLGAGQVPVIQSQLHFPDAKSKIEYYKLRSRLIPYLGTAEYEELCTEINPDEKQLTEVDHEGKLTFDGLYGPNLFGEIHNYAIVAGKLAREMDIDIIHVHDWMCFPAGQEAKRVSGKPLVVHVHSTEFDRNGTLVNPYICKIERDGMVAADKIIAVSNFTRRKIIEHYGINPAKVKTIHNATMPIESSSTTMSAQYTPDHVVSFLGRVTWQKGPEYFVEAANLVIKEIKNIRFVMAGKGDLLEDMKQKADALNISGYFHFPGFLPDDEIMGLFRASDVFIMPSTSEPFGLVALEAMQAGTPTIISKQSGVSEVIKNAIKVDYWDTGAMADAICKILSNPEYKKTLAKNGKKEVQKIIWKKVAIETEKIYHNILKQ